MECYLLWRTNTLEIDSVVDHQGPRNKSDKENSCDKLLLNRVPVDITPTRGFCVMMRQRYVGNPQG